MAGTQTQSSVSSVLSVHVYTELFLPVSMPEPLFLFFFIIFIYLLVKWIVLYLQTSSKSEQCMYTVSLSHYLPALSQQLTSDPQHKHTHTHTCTLCWLGVFGGHLVPGHLP